MMKGEGTSEALPTKSVSLNDELLTWKVSNQELLDRNNETSPISSRYSSFGESEFDKYCSANSAMGTPSLCGSVGTFHDFPDSDIGSVKSSRFGDLGGLENFSLGGKLERMKSEDKKSLALGRLREYSQRSDSFDLIRGLKRRNDEKSEQKLMASEHENLSFDGLETSFQDLPDGGGVTKWKDNINSKTMESTSVHNSNITNISAETMEESSESHMESTCDQVNNLFESRRHLEEGSEGETSSRLEHSESEGSMYGYGTDNEQLTNSLPKGYTNYSHDNKSNKENTLLMNSSVAYGADDLDEFLQETMENPTDLFIKNETQENAEDLGMNIQMNVAHELPSFSNNHSISHSDFMENEEKERGQLVEAIAKKAEDVNQLKMEEEAPLMDVLPKKSEDNSKKTTSNLKIGGDDFSMAEDKNSYSRHINVEKKLDDAPVSLNISEDLQTASKAENCEPNEFYDEVVYEMEEILLDSGESPAARFTRGRKHHVSLPSRDGSSTASTSSIDNNSQPSDQNQKNSHKIDGIQVIGAKQRKGDVSLGERLVGVKEYTVYTIRIWSGTHQWDVERRYRDFFTLYRQLKTSFANKGMGLPSPWSAVDRESRKYFGNSSPDVVSERSLLIQECLRSILNSNFSLPSSMLWFLSPPKNEPGFPDFDPRISKPTPGFTLGQSISLIVEIRAHKSMRQMLEAQHYTCAGCHKYFDEGKTRLWEFVQSLGWGKPRVCEYSGQVFCSGCHINESAILPARVLHLWDFTEYPVSQLAKSYLDSIHDKPMLCVSAVNPFLFSRVPALQHVINVRKRIGRMLPYVRCPYRRSIYKGVGSRRYILESSDFFALKDLVDLSKGVFAALPVMVETISKKIVDHITDECLICYDVGVPCGARQACDDPSSLIFPFQEGETERCKSCELVYHKACYKKTVSCPCGVDRSARRSPNEIRVAPNNMEHDTESKSPMGFFTGMFSRVNSVKLRGTKDSNTVIPMGSLPNSSL